MKIALFFHCYQPPTQLQEVTQEIVRSCYLPLFSLIKKYPAVRLTVNTPASFWEQLAVIGVGSLREDLVKLARSGQVELTQTAAFHPLLTKISPDEIRRQVRLNRELLTGFLGGDLVGNGFFPPEMACNERVGEVLAELGIHWVLLDEIHKSPDLSGQFFKTGRGLTAVFRNSKESLTLAFGEVRTAPELVNQLSGNGLEEAILAVDGETFGHHLPWGIAFLEDLFKLSGSQVELVTVSDICPPSADLEVVALREATWATTSELLAEGILYPHWDLGGNKVHQMQWKLLNLAVQSVQSSKCAVQRFVSGEDSSGVGGLKPEVGGEISDRRSWLEARELLDRALHSDQFWWASHNPNWHLGMVERGARMLVEVISRVPDVVRSDEQYAQDLYGKIIKTGRALYGDAVVN